MKELSQRPLVLLDLPKTWTYLLALFDFAARRPKLGFRTRSYETVRTAVTNGLGVSVLNIKPVRRAPTVKNCAEFRSPTRYGSRPCSWRTPMAKTNRHM